VLCQIAEEGFDFGLADLHGMPFAVEVDVALQ